MFVLAFLLTLMIVVGTHEMGHALVAYWFGVKIERISIGFGRPLFSWKTQGGCEWVWSLWPIGGYVKLLNTRIMPVSEQEKHLSFDHKPIWQRCLILIAGCFTNLLVAYCCFVLFFMSTHQQTLPIVQKVIPNSIAAQAGIHPQDRIIAIAHQATASWQEVGKYLLVYLGNETVEVTLAHGQEPLRTVNLNLKNIFKKPQPLLSWLGITLDRAQQNIQIIPGQTFIAALSKAFIAVQNLIWFFLMLIKQIATGVVPLSLLLGPLGLISVSASAFSYGFATFMYFIANLSVAVGLVNLFPIPGLDGGSILWALVEKVRGKPVSVPFEWLCFQFAKIAFYVLLIQLVVNDIEQWLRMRPH